MLERLIRDVALTAGAIGLIYCMYTRGDPVVIFLCMLVFYAYKE